MNAHLADLATEVDLDRVPGRLGEMERLQREIEV